MQLLKMNARYLYMKNNKYLIWKKGTGQPVWYNPNSVNMSYTRLLHEKDLEDDMSNR